MASRSPVVAAGQDAAGAAHAYWSTEQLATALPLPLPVVAADTLRGVHAPPPEAQMQFGPGGRPYVPHDAAPAGAFARFPLNQGPARTSLIDPKREAFRFPMPFNNRLQGDNETYPYSTAGKLFFVVPEGASLPAGNYVCSAAVALNDHTVVTARQCLYDVATGKWYSGWAFFPGWNNGPNAALGGEWDANFAYTWTGGAAGYFYDIGLLAMHDSTGQGCAGKSGQTIGSIAGWLGYSYDGSYALRQWEALGYPQSEPYDGNSLFEDSTVTAEVNPAGAGGMVEAGNPQGDGAGGGPWILGLYPNSKARPSPVNNTSGMEVNEINGLNSIRLAGDGHIYAIAGPVFETANFWKLYVGYQKVACM